MYRPSLPLLRAWRVDGSWRWVKAGSPSPRHRLIADRRCDNLSAAHYQYIKEIPMFADYEIRISIGGFEDKWVSTVAAATLRCAL